MGKSDEYRRYANECFELASTLQSPEAQAVLVPIVNLIRWRGRPNRAMFLPDVGWLQTDLVAADRAIPIESNA
jgi:hypothetical protein